MPRNDKRNGRFGRPANSGSFKKGHKKLGGRKTGTLNNDTRIMKEALLSAVEDHSGNLATFLRKLIAKDPRAIATMLTRLMPMQVDAKRKTEVVYRTTGELRRDLLERHLPLRHMQAQLLDLKAEEDGTVTQGAAANDGGADTDSRR